MAWSDDAEPAVACPIEIIAAAYLAATDGDADRALRLAVTDAMSDLMDSDTRTRGRSRLISRGCTRVVLDDAAGKAINPRLPGDPHGAVRATSAMDGRRTIDG